LLEFQTKFLKKIKLSTSKSSCKFEDIEGFIYGPFTSRFWLMRKHIIQMSVRDLVMNCPFYAWDCITLQIKGKGEVFLVIKNEEIMTRLLKMLIYELKTIDGNQNTAVHAIKKGVRRLMTKYGYVDELKQQEYEKIVRHQIMQKVYFSYSLMRVK